MQARSSALTICGPEFDPLPRRCERRNQGSTTSRGASLSPTRRSSRVHNELKQVAQEGLAGALQAAGEVKSRVPLEKLRHVHQEGKASVATRRMGRPAVLQEEPAEGVQYLVIAVQPVLDASEALSRV